VAKVGGAYGEALLVSVSARAVDGQATESALRAVAEALGVPRRDVRLVTGATSRDKVIEIENPPPELIDRLCQLRDGK